jgi:hypothetical protein
MTGSLSITRVSKVSRYSSAEADTTAEEKWI